MTEVHDGQMFSTRDRDNDNSASQNCAETNSGPWWYGNCSAHANLNGKHQFEQRNDVKFINWWKWSEIYGSGEYALKETKMMLQAKL